MRFETADLLMPPQEYGIVQLIDAIRRVADNGAAFARRAGLRAWQRRAWLAVVGVVFAFLLLLTVAETATLLAAFLVIASVVVAVPGDGESDDERQGLPDFHRGGSRGGAGDSWQALVDAIPDAAVALGRDGTILHHNMLVPELFPSVRTGHPLSHLSRNPELNAAAEAALLSNEPIVVQMFERVPVERRISATVSRLAPTARHAGLPALLITFRDLTEQDRLAQMRADFIANASHELRTPLASLRGFVETLQGPARDDPVARQKFLGIMASQAARMTRLIDDLLSLSRVEMRVHLPPKGVVELNEVASYVAQTLEPVAEASKITIAVTRLDGAARIRGEREEIVQVLQNLLHNAIKYGHEGGHVQVKVGREVDGQRSEPRLLVAVSDDGPGISPEHLPRLTERFYRANVSTSREKGGTGLGLAIVKHIMIRHRGDLRITSEVGKGSMFTVLYDELPASPNGGLFDKKNSDNKY